MFVYSVACSLEEKDETGPQDKSNWGSNKTVPNMLEEQTAAVTLQPTASRQQHVGQQPDAPGNPWAAKFCERSGS